MTTTVRTTDDLIDNLTMNGWQAVRVGLGGNTDAIEIRSASKPGEYVLATDYYGARCPLTIPGLGLLVCSYRDDDSTEAVPLAEVAGGKWTIATLSSALYNWVNG